MTPKRLSELNDLLLKIERLERIDCDRRGYEISTCDDEDPVFYIAKYDDELGRAIATSVAKGLKKLKKEFEEA